MPDRPARMAFAEAQYAALGVRAVRVAGMSKPDKLLGGLLAWQHAVDACTNHSGSERYCIVAEDDAVYRPVDQKAAEDLEENGWPEFGKANTTADSGTFFPALAASLEQMPGGTEGSWTGLHLCTLGEMISLSMAEGGPKNRVIGSPWPNERFSRHAVFPGAPDALLLQRKEAPLYGSRLRAAINSAWSNKTPIDVLQSQMYRAEDTNGANIKMQVSVAKNPQLCQHLTDLTNDHSLRSSVGDGASARNPGEYKNKWGT